MSPTKKHLHVIGIGGIGVSALARYYEQQGYSVSGSDGADSPFLDALRAEGMGIHIGHSADNLPDDTDLVIYSEAIITKPDLPPAEQIYANVELAKARDLGIPHFSYPVALAQVFDREQGIAITGSHGKSTTTAMTAIMLANHLTPTPSPGGEGTGAILPISPPFSEGEGDGGGGGCSAIIGTQVPQLGNTNFYTEIGAKNFVIEACEYKRSFLQYHPHITVITNIDLDHLDYYKNLEDYISAFQSLVDQTSGFVIISADDANSEKLTIPDEKKIIVGNGKIVYFPRVEETIGTEKKIYTVQKDMPLPAMKLQVPGDHLLQDAYLAYTVGRLLGMEERVIVPKLESYRGSWRRAEIIGRTKHGNILMSDYGHHPNEIRPTLAALRAQYPDKKIFVVFQPHQYSRTRELLQDFATSFDDASEIIIPDIYFSRDKQEDVEWMTVDKLIHVIEQSQTGHMLGRMIINGHGLKNTAKLIREYDSINPDSAIILLLGAGDIDSLRHEIPLQSCT